MVYISTCTDNGIERVDENGNKVICNGYYCQVYMDENLEEQIDDFCLAVGFELKDDTDKELARVLREYRKSYEHIKSIDELWMAACSGDLETLKHYYRYESDIINRRYKKFGKQHSLIMGAFRNNQLDVVEYLISVGETVTPEEKEEIAMELKRMELLRHIGGME